jgi:type II secretory pathway pseudopilin PulG
MRRHSIRPDRSRATTAFTLVELLVAMGIAGLVLAAVATHLIESSALGLKTAHTLEHVRNSRQLVAELSADIRAAQFAVLYPEFDDRSVELASGQTGNYLVLHRMDASGAIVSTVGYYLEASGSVWQLRRHDSAAGHSAAGAMPAAGTLGTHPIATRVVQLPGTTGLFTRLRENGYIVRGQFGRAEGASLGRNHYVHFAACTRS